MTCNCDPTKPVDPGTPETPDAPIVTPPASELPRASKLNIPVHAFVNLSPLWYTEASEIPVGSVPLDAHVAATPGTLDVPYYPEVYHVDVECFPLPTLVFPENVRVVESGVLAWRIYPTESDEFYFEVEWQIVDEELGKIRGRYNVTMFGGETAASQPVDIPLTVVAMDAQAVFTIHVDAPTIEVSQSHVWLVPDMGYEASVDIKSNLRWWINV